MNLEFVNVSRFLYKFDKFLIFFDSGQSYNILLYVGTEEVEVSVSAYYTNRILLVC